MELQTEYFKLTRNIVTLSKFFSIFWPYVISLDQAVLETVARVKTKKNETKEEKYVAVPFLQDCFSPKYLVSF